MSTALKKTSFPAPQPPPQGMGSKEPIPQWRSGIRRTLNADIVHRSWALGTFVLAIIFVMAVAGGALAQVDSDNDGLSDDAEVSIHRTDPNNGDSDLDGLPDGVEVGLGTDPLNADTDGDGASDAEEYLAGNDPLEASSAPVGVAVTSVPTTVVSGSNQATTTPPAAVAPVEQSPVTVSPEAAPTADGLSIDDAPETLAFNDSVPSDRSPLFPLFAAFAVVIGVGMFLAIRRIPKLGSSRL